MPKPLAEDPSLLPHKQSPSTTAARWLAGKTLADLQAVELGGKVLTPDVFRHRRASGEIAEEPVLIRVPLLPDLIKARKDAIAYVAKKMDDKSIKTQEQARAAVGAAYWEQIDTAAIVALCTYEMPEKGHVPEELPQSFMLLEILVEAYLPKEIDDVFQHMDLLSRMSGVRIVDLTEDQFLVALAGIARTGNLSPFGDMPGDTQVAFIVAACEKLWKLLMESSSPTSSST